MKRLMLPVLCLLVLLMFTVNAFADVGEPPDGDTMGTGPGAALDEIDEYLAALGIGPLLVLVVETLKRIGAIPDGQAGKVTMVLSAVVFAVLVALGAFAGIDLGGDGAQTVVGSIEAVLKIVLGFVSAVGTFKVARAAQVINPLPVRAAAAVKRGRKGGRGK